MRYNVFRIHKNFFFDSPPPPPHRRWTSQALQDFCKEEMLDAGFNLNREISCWYDPGSGDLVFLQEPSEGWGEFTYSLN